MNQKLPPMPERTAAVSSRYETSAMKTSLLLRRLWKYFYACKGLLLLALFMNLLSNLFALAGPKLSGYAIDAVAPGAGRVDFVVVFRFAAWMAAFYLLSFGLSYVLSILMIRLSRRVVYSMRRDLFARLSSLPVSYFDSRKVGDIISVISYDIDTLNASLSSDLLQALTSILTVAGSLAMMLTISPRLLLVFGLTVPVSIVFSRYRAKKVRPLYRRRSAKTGELNGYMEESAAGIKTIKVYNQEAYFLGCFDQKNDDAMEAAYQADRFASITGPSVNFINNLSLALVSIFGALLYMVGGFTLGSLSSFVLYSRKFSGPINEFANITSDLQSAMAAAERVFRLMDEMPETADRPGAAELHAIRGHVRMEHVDFGYVPGKPVIHDLSLDVAQGSVIAIVGPTGAGKTTLINLLMRFYDVDSGSIAIDGYDVRDIQRRSLRKAYTMVLQDAWLFHGTIFENIAYGSRDASREEVVRAARLAKIHDYILSLPEGYDTLLSNNAVSLSKGQRQLLIIARAILMDSKILLLDEATSNVDTQTEKQIQSAMLHLMSGRTCFIIAHRLSTIQNADRILVLSEGRILEDGKHAELMERRGLYFQMYQAQFETA
jgi:ATP-binding cassette subfamily B protein